MKLIIKVVIFLSILSCTTSKKVVKVKYQSDFLTDNLNSSFKKKTFWIKIPKDYEVINEDYNPEYKEVIYKYLDSSIIYITDNNLSGSSLNAFNKKAIGVDIVSKKLNDSINYFGKQRDGKYWKEAFYGEIVVGYLNVSANMKQEFDKAITSLIRKKVQ